MFADETDVPSDASEFGLAGFIHAMHGKDGLGEINSNDDHAHDFPS